MLEWRIARSDLVNYSGDLMTPPDGTKGGKRINVLGKKNKSIRGKATGADDDSSDDNDW